MPRTERTSGQGYGASSLPAPSAPSATTTTVPALPALPVPPVPPTAAERRWRRAAVRFVRHLLRVNALRAFAAATVALGVLTVVGADSSVGQGALVVIGTLISFVLLPEEPSRFWRVRAEDMAETVPPSDLRTAGRATTQALALQSGGIVGEGFAGMLWDDALAHIDLAVSDPHRIALDVDYRVSVSRDGGRQLVRSTLTGKHCWPGLDRVFFSFCSDVEALSREFAAMAEGSILREIVPPASDESIDGWERRVSAYPVVMVVDGVNLDPFAHETRRFNGLSAAHRVIFDVSGSAIRERFTPVRSVAEFHQAAAQHEYTMKFASYFCLGATQLSLEVDDSTAEIDANAFLRSPRAETNFFHHYGLASHRVTLQTGADAVLHPGSGVVFSWRPGPLLARVPAGIEHLVEQGDPVPVHPGLPTALVPTAGRDEPLVALDGVRCLDAYHTLGLIEQPRVLAARQEVVRRLEAAQAELPSGFSFVVLDAWRSPDLQRHLSDTYRAQHGPGADAYVADPASTTMRPPHVVGAALDLTLAHGGRPLALGSAYDEFTPAAHLDAFEETDSSVRRLRRLMARALTHAGFAPYPYEWWHWSYGDDVWAAHVGQDALYDIVSTRP